MVIVLIVFGIYYIYNSRTHSFLNVISLDKEKLTSIEIKHNDEKVILNDKGEINNFINTVSYIKLKKSNKSAKGFDESYWIRIFEDDKEVYGLTFYDNGYLYSFNFSSDKTNKYKIVNDNDLDIKKFMR